MGSDHVTGKHIGDIFIAIQRNVQHEIRSCHHAVLGRCILHYVSIQDAPCRVRMANHESVMEIQNGIDSGYTGINPFRTTGKACIEMGLNKSGDNFEGTLDIGFVEKYFRLVTIAANMTKLALVKCVVVLHSYAIYHLFT